MIVFDGQFGGLGQIGQANYMGASFISPSDIAEKATKGPLYAMDESGNVARVGVPVSNVGLSFRFLAGDGQYVPVLSNGRLSFISAQQFLGSWRQVDAYAYYTKSRDTGDMDLGVFSPAKMQKAAENGFNVAEAAKTLIQAGQKIAAQNALKGARSDRDQITVGANVLFRLGVIDGALHQVLISDVALAITDIINSTQAAIAMEDTGVIGQIINRAGVVAKGLVGVGEKLQLSDYEKIKKVYAATASGYLKAKASFEADGPIGQTQREAHEFMGAGVAKMYSALLKIEASLRAAGVGVDEMKRQAGLGVAPVAIPVTIVGATLTTKMVLGAILLTTINLTYAAYIFTKVGEASSSPLTKEELLEQEKLRQEVEREFLTSEEGLKADIELQKLRIKRAQEVQAAVSSIKAEPGESLYIPYASAGAQTLGKIGAIAGDKKVVEDAKAFEGALRGQFGIKQLEVTQASTLGLGILGAIVVALLIGGKNA